MRVRDQARESLWGIAALGLAFPPMALHVLLGLTVKNGVREHEGAGELFGWALLSTGVLTPFVAIFAIIGLVRRDRRHRASIVSLLLVIFAGIFVYRF